MEKLNELAELAKKATQGKWWIDSHGHSMVAFSGKVGDVEVVFATDNDMGPLIRHEDTGNLSHWRNDNDATFIASANPETIIAIAEHVQELEQRAEAAEAKLALVREQRDSELNRNTELEAKLAELDKQEPVAFDIQDSDARERGEKGFLRRFANISDADIAEYEINIQPLYTRPAPAVNLADLAESLILAIEKEQDRLLDEDYLMDSQECIDVIREEILRKIEEATNEQTIPAAKVGSVADTEVQAGSEDASDEGKSK